MTEVIGKVSRGYAISTNFDIMAQLCRVVKMQVDQPINPSIGQIIR